MIHSFINAQRVSWRAQEALTMIKSSITHLSRSSFATNEPMAPNLAKQNSFNQIDGSAIFLMTGD